MYQSLGRIGRIEEVYPDGDLKIGICNTLWTYNAMSLQQIFNFKTSVSSFPTAELFREIANYSINSEVPEEEFWKGILISDINLVNKWHKQGLKENINPR
jgi:hypothetical protein